MTNSELSRNYKAVLLAAGFGSRLGSYTELLPKCLMPVHGSPIVTYWLDELVRSKITEVYINTHFMAEKVENFLSLCPGYDNFLVVREPNILGTAGTLRNAAQWLDGDPALVIHADNYSSVNVDALIAEHEKNRTSGGLITMLVFRTEFPQNCGIVELDGRRVTSFHEKIPNPPGNCANGAVYVIEPEVVQRIFDEPNWFDFSTDVIPNFLRDIFTFELEGFHVDIGTPETLRLANSVKRLDLSQSYDLAINSLPEQFKILNKRLSGEKT